MTDRFSYIRGISWILPEKVYSNEDFFMDFPEHKTNLNLLKVGVLKRHVIDPSQTASDLAEQAARKYFEEHSLKADEVDFLIYCSLDFDHMTPSTSGILQHKLGIPESAGTLDFNHGCSGYPYALLIAKGLIETGASSNVLILTSSSLTKMIHPKDKSSRFVFGDGAAATLVSLRKDNWGIGVSDFGSRGKDAKKIIVEHGMGRQPLSTDSYDEKVDEYGNYYSKAHFYMDGMGVFLFSIKTVPVLVNNLLLKNKMSIEDIDLFVFHQANAFMNETIRKKLGIPEEKFMVYFSEVGNTVASTIPIALQMAMSEGKVRTGSTVLLAGFGTGLSWCGTIIRL